MSNATDDVLREEDDGLAELVYGGGSDEDGFRREDSDNSGGGSSSGDEEDDEDEDDDDARMERRSGFGGGSSEEEEEEEEEEDDDDALRGSESDIDSGSEGKDEEGEDAEAGRKAKRAKAGRSREVKADPVHVRGQLLLWDKALDARIRLQRAVAAANRIPASRRVIDAMVNHAPRGTRDALTSVRAGVRTALGAVLGLLGAAQSQQGQLAPASGGPNPPPARTSAVSSAAAKIGADTPLDTLDAMLAGQLKEQLDFACVDEWNRVANAASGAYSAKQFKAMNQDVTEQVAQTLARSRPKLVAKVQERKHEAKPTLCADLGVADDVVDDSEFYASLLREYLEAQLAGGDGNATKILASTLHAKKVRKNVDRRASKGRKLRYHVMEKLVGFMPSARSVRELGGVDDGGNGEEKDEDDETFERILAATLFRSAPGRED